MFKKILMWTIYAGVVGLLIFGAVIRTEAKTGLRILQPETSLEGKELLQNGQEVGGASISGGGFGRNSSTSGEGEEIRQAENEKHEWASLVGVVASLDLESLWIETSQGETAEITGRAWSFILDSGMIFSVGDEVGLEGFYENDEFEVSSIEDLTTSAFLQVRDESGRPLWSGGAGH